MGLFFEIFFGQPQGCTPTAVVGFLFLQGTPRSGRLWHPQNTNKIRDWPAAVPGCGGSIQFDNCLALSIT
jgi:hypothetical protein